MSTTGMAAVYVGDTPSEIAVALAASVLIRLPFLCLPAVFICIASFFFCRKCVAVRLRGHLGTNAADSSKPQGCGGGKWSVYSAVLARLSTWRRKSMADGGVTFCRRLAIFLNS